LAHIQQLNSVGLRRSVTATAVELAGAARRACSAATERDLTIARVERNLSRPVQMQATKALVKVRRRFRVRQQLRGAVAHPVWNGVVMGLILGSTVVLCMDSAQLQRDPSPEAEATRSVLTTLNYTFAALFSAEMLIKICALGLRGYCADPWNNLDFVVVLISWLTVSDSGSLSGFRSLRTLRGLRPLRLISRLPAMQIVIEALARAFSRIAYVFLVLTVVQVGGARARYLASSLVH
jgi:hypothetical protein